MNLKDLPVTKKNILSQALHIAIDSEKASISSMEYDHAGLPTKDKQYKQWIKTAQENIINFRWLLDEMGVK